MCFFVLGLNLKPISNWLIFVELLTNFISSTGMLLYFIGAFGVSSKINKQAFRSYSLSAMSVHTDSQTIAYYRDDNLPKLPDNTNSPIFPLQFA